VEDGLAHFRTMRHSERGVRLRCGVVELRDAAALDEAIGECDACILRAARQRAEQDAAARVPALDAPPIVLLAEDDELTARLLAHRLEREGMILVRAADGHAASELLATAEFDLAVFDVMLPGRDGYELLAQLRGTPATATRPALMLTGRTAEADIARALELGADDYVVKPFSPVELMARIRRLLHRRAPNAA